MFFSNKVKKKRDIGICKLLILKRLIVFIVSLRKRGIFMCKNVKYFFTFK